MDKVISLMDLSRGTIRQLQDESALFCASTARFCKELHFDQLSVCLAPYARKLSYGVPDVYVPLARLGQDVMTSSRSKVLYRAGFKSPADLVQASATDLAVVLKRDLPHTSQRPTEASMKPAAVAPAAGAGAAVAGSGRAGRGQQQQHGLDVDEQLANAACLRLAKRLQQRAAQRIKEEHILHTILLQSSGAAAVEGGNSLREGRYALEAEQETEQEWEPGTQEEEQVERQRTDNLFYPVAAFRESGPVSGAVEDQEMGM